VDPDEPEQTLWAAEDSFEGDFPPVKRNLKGRFGSDLDDYEAVSFDFGKGKVGWSLLTVYVLMKSGDLFAITPVIPKSR
jgi:nucleoporin NUP82